ncbi:MAG: formate C-acetyltransferase [Spirochaetia bacterium]|nr:formate C-acetyltransferase [Spirochaetia bacterium]MBO7429733.1 formate C-acetyltransferase [Spirochaetia bacterium]
MNFNSGDWENTIDVRDFIQKNYTPYDGDGSFLAGPTERTKKLWEELSVLLEKERNSPGRVLDADTKVISGITSHPAGYINKDLEIIVGLQTEKPLKRAIMPFGGVRMVEQALEEHGYHLDPEVKKIFKYRKSHNESVFGVYTDDIRAARSSKLLTGLPDAYGRGRIIGDYRRVALYGVDFLINKKQKAKIKFDRMTMSDFIVRKREEINLQLEALEQLKELGNIYGFDISKPAKDTKEAIQWLYFGYLAAVKEQNGAAMSLGRTSTFLDIYAERDLKEGRYTEQEIQEMVDQFIIKLRIVRFLRTLDYDNIFAGDPVWVTESIGGVGLDGRHMVTKMSYRFLHTLENLGPAPEPNLTILWSTRLPENFKHFATNISIETSSIQYENDDLMRVDLGDDYGIACCVSPMRIGKQMQFFGARANLAKCLLYAINGGVDEITGKQVAPPYKPITDDYLDYDEVMMRFEYMSNYLATVYTKALYMIHYMHDKYNYETIEMALMDERMKRTMACGLAGLSVVADSLSAIKYAKVKVIRNEKGLAVDYEIEGDYPKYGNNDDRVDSIAVQVTKMFMNDIRKNKMYRDSTPTQSILTITSNVEYGKNTGSTPDGRKKGVPLAPGANPMHGRDTNGALASLLSVAKIPWADAQDGISYTFSMAPSALGKSDAERSDNLITLLDGYMAATGQHLNVNVLNRETLMDAMEHPEKYPQLTIRVSGYAVNFIKLSREQQLDVISRTFHEKM